MLHGPTPPFPHHQPSYCCCYPQAGYARLPACLRPSKSPPHCPDLSYTPLPPSERPPALDGLDLLLAEGGPAEEGRQLGERLGARRALDVLVPAPPPHMMDGMTSHNHSSSSSSPSATRAGRQAGPHWLPGWLAAVVVRTGRVVLLPAACRVPPLPSSPLRPTTTITITTAHHQQQLLLSPLHHQQRPACLPAACLWCGPPSVRTLLLLEERALAQELDERLAAMSSSLLQPAISHTALPSIHDPPTPLSVSPSVHPSDPLPHPPTHPPELRRWRWRAPTAGVPGGWQQQQPQWPRVGEEGPRSQAPPRCRS